MPVVATVVEKYKNNNDNDEVWLDEHIDDDDWKKTVKTSDHEQPSDATPNDCRHHSSFIMNGDGLEKREVSIVARRTKTEDDYGNEPFVLADKPTPPPSPPLAHGRRQDHQLVGAFNVFGAPRRPPPPPDDTLSYMSPFSSSTNNNYPIVGGLDNFSRAASDLTTDDTTTTTTTTTSTSTVFVNAELVHHNYNKNNKQNASFRSLQQTTTTSRIYAVAEEPFHLMDGDKKSKLDSTTTTDVKICGRRQCFQCFVIFTVLIFLFLLTGTILAIFQIMSGFHPPATTPPTMSPSNNVVDDVDVNIMKSHQERVQNLLKGALSNISELELPLFEEDYDDDSPQTRAYNWIKLDYGSIDISNERLLQRYALAVIYFSTGGILKDDDEDGSSSNDDNDYDGWYNSERWLSKKHECEWYGIIKCNHDVITWLDLSSNHLYSSTFIPNELGLLSKLEYLDMSDNDWNHATIPSYILTQLLSLKELSISHGALSGTLPSELGLLTNITDIFLDSNIMLSGTIPSEILLLLTSLQHLDLSHNSFNGTIPTTTRRKRDSTTTTTTTATKSKDDDSSGKQYSLSYLNLKGNYLSGTIPTKIGKLSSSINELFLGDNLFTGTIPSELGMLTMATILDLQYNQLSGTIPCELGYSLFTIEDLYFNGNNELEGSIPTTFVTFTNLQELDVSNTRIDSVVPLEVCDALNIHSDDEFHLIVPCIHNDDNEESTTLEICNCCTECKS